MKQMLRWTILLLTLSLFIGCEKEKASEDISHEEATVVGTYFRPAYEDTTITPSTDGEGNVTFSTSTEYHPDYWEASFRCQHGFFTVRGDKAKSMCTIKKCSGC
jgi:hypothetical protein